MEAFLLALCLRVIRPAVRNTHAKPHQPDAETGQRIAARVAPRRTPVHQHGERQAIATEGLLQAPAHRRSLLVAAGRQNEVVARMVVERGQRMAAPGMGGEVALKSICHSSFGLARSKRVHGPGCSAD